jgi:hypothetical protein
MEIKGFPAQLNESDYSSSDIQYQLEKQGIPMSDLLSFVNYVTEIANNATKFTDSEFYYNDTELAELFPDVAYNETKFAEFFPDVEYDEMSFPDVADNETYPKRFDLPFNALMQMDIYVIEMVLIVCATHHISSTFLFLFIFFLIISRILGVSRTQAYFSHR